jgi:hypothetical protein
VRGREQTETPDHDDDDDGMEHFSILYENMNVVAASRGEHTIDGSYCNTNCKHPMMTPRQRDLPVIDTLGYSPLASSASIKFHALSLLP